MRRPSIKTPCVADRYSGDNERIAEFQHGTEGGLISIRRHPHTGRLIVEIYRVSEGVDVIAPGIA